MLTRKLARRRFNELRTARVVTTQGSRYLSGTGDSFLTLLLVMVLLCAGRKQAVLLLADGARWIRNWFAALQAVWASSTHDSGLVSSAQALRRTGEYDLSRSARESGAAGAAVPASCGRGRSTRAIALLEAYRPQARNSERLEELIQYLRDRQPYIPNYRQRRRERQYIGSGHAEKANDLIVAKRQKGAGMHWSVATSDALGGPAHAHAEWRLGSLLAASRGAPTGGNLTQDLFALTIISYIFRTGGRQSAQPEVVQNQHVWPQIGSAAARSSHRHGHR